MFGSIKKAFSALPNKVVVPLVIFIGIGLGLGVYTTYMSRALSYLGNDPATCVNCHVMTPAYAAWSRSSHRPWTTCKDCHVPQNNLLAGYWFEAMDGIYHGAVFTMRDESPAPRPRPASWKVIMDNCVRCHTQLNTALVKTGRAKFSDIEHGRQKPCWDCHRNTPHGRVSGLASAPHAIVPLPGSPVPEWLKKLMD
ncbi:MAG: cytochrome c nitrite reductase small subunit [Zoogloeaceae bacterium]|jgi:cytochrome c nitrite reductase small subunit|nr:cytochrome c nitrite reductase small subunit [Zoogloeaceae bacterium]